MAGADAYEGDCVHVLPVSLDGEGSAHRSDRSYCLGRVMKDLSSSSQGEALRATLGNSSHTILNVMKRREGAATEPIRRLKILMRS